MKLAIILPSLAHKGPILVARDIVKHLHNKVDQIDVYYFDDIVEVKFDCPVHRIDFSQPIDFDRYDIIHSHMYRPDKYIWKFRSSIKAQCISTVHCDIRQDLKYTYGWLISAVFRWVWILFLRKQNKVVVLTEWISKVFYSKVLGAEKVCVIYNGRKVNEFSEIDSEDKILIESLKKNYKILGVCALLTKRKGIHQVVKALPEMPDHALVIVGDGEEKQRLMQLAQTLNIADRCLFLGFRKGGESYLPYFDVFMMPSYSEGFPLALIEATLLKKSCVCSDLPIFREIYTEQEISFFELEDTASIKKAITTAYIEKATKGENAYQKTIRQYTVEKMAEQYLKLYENIGKNVGF